MMNFCKLYWLYLLHRASFLIMVKNRDYQRMLRTIEREEREADYAFEYDKYEYSLAKPFCNDEDYRLWCSRLTYDIETGIRDYHYQDSLI